MIFSFREGKEILLKKGSLALLHRNRDNGFYFRDGMCHKMALICSGSNLDVLLDTLKLKDCDYLSLDNPSEMETRFRGIMNLIKEQLPGTETFLSEKVYSLLLKIGELWNDGRKEYPPELISALEFIERSFREPIKIPDIAMAAGISRSSLIRLFHRFLGVHPHAWLLKTRMEFAASLLKSDSGRIKEIAWNAGYDNPLNFSTVFRKYFGVSPSKYKRID